MIRFFCLGSGSSGNATLIDCDGVVFLVDMGLPKLTLKSQLVEIGYQLDDIAYFIFTHDHIDHIRSADLSPLDRRYGALGVVEMPIDNVLVPYNEYQFGNTKILALPLSHDSKCSLGFVFYCNDEKLVYITDTGYINNRVLALLKNADYYIFESNHDIKMLMKSARPAYLKKRILSDKGHLSNEQAANYLITLIGEKTREIILIHLSEVANDNEHALKAFYDIAQKNFCNLDRINVKCAKRHEITKIYGVTHGN